MEFDVVKAAEIFEELVDRANAGEEIVITVDGVPAARLVPYDADFKKFLMTGESFEGLDLTRDQSPTRDIDLE